MNYEFLKAYNALDELCKQILRSDKGVSTYISLMEREYYRGVSLKSRFNSEYKWLKRVRFVRNQIAHESDSLVIAEVDDLNFVKNFRQRIMNQTDPFAIVEVEKRAQEEERRKRQRAQAKNGVVVEKKSKKEGAIVRFFKWLFRKKDE
ncbi:MAG: hypothetical protein IJ309_03205 [Clostridia bacterium]|nr:hypothetical protein [Clostridia bacterium]